MLELSATELSRLVASRTVAPSEVMADYLGRLPANGAVNAIVGHVDPDLLMARARAADDAPRAGWLHGMPFAVKDLVAVRGLRTTWGSPLFADHVPDADDLLAARLRAAGAIFVGRTNTPEWGHGSHTFNPVHGVTRNPHDPARSAGGSSGGAAAALALRLVPVADGSDMMGSLRNPAAFCNVYGFRPTWGLVPSGGAEGFLSTLSTEGPMARTVEDLAGLLAVMAGAAPGVPFGREVPEVVLDREPRGLRIGWLGDWGGALAMEPGILAICEAALAQWEGMGARVVPLPPPFPAGEMWRAWVTLRAYLNAQAMRDIRDDPATLSQVKPETRWEIDRGRAVTADAVHAASRVRTAWFARVAEVFGTVDLLALPSAQVWPFPAEWRWPARIGGVEMDSYHRWMEVAVPASFAGLPALSVPVGFGAAGSGEAGLPMGMQLIGAAGADARVLAAGQAWHLATGWPERRPPAGVLRGAGSAG